MSTASTTVSRLDGWWGWRAPPPQSEPSKQAETAETAVPMPAGKPADAVEAPRSKPVARGKTDEAKSKPAPPPTPPTPEVSAQSLQLVWGPGEVAPGGKADHAAICAKLNLRPDDHLIEIGCGLGGFALHATQNNGVKVTAADFDPMLIRIAEDLAGAKVSFKTATRFPFSLAAEPANAAIVRHAIGETAPAEFLAGIEPLLAPGGRLVLQEFCCAPDDTATRSGLAQHDLSASDPEAIVAAALAAGLTISGLDDETQPLINRVVESWSKLEPKLASGELPPPVVAALEAEAAKWAQLSALLGKNGGRFLRITLDAAPPPEAPKPEPDVAPESLRRRVAQQLGGLAESAGRLFRRKKNKARN